MYHVGTCFTGLMIEWNPLNRLTSDRFDHTAGTIRNFLESVDNCYYSFCNSRPTIELQFVECRMTINVEM